MKNTKSILRIIFVMGVFCSAPVLGQKELGDVNAAESEVQDGKLVDVNIARPAAESWGRFETKHGAQWKVRWNKKTGLLRMMYGGTTESFAGNAKDAAREFLDKYTEMFLNVDTSIAKAATKLRFASEREALGGTIVTFQQTVYEIRVAKGMVDVFVDPNGCIHHVNCSTVSKTDINIIPSLTSDEAVGKLRNTLEDSNGFTLLAPPELVIWSNGNVSLAYEIQCSIGESWNVWEYYVDGHTGEILESNKLVVETKQVETTGNGETVNQTKASDEVKKKVKGEETSPKTSTNIEPFGPILENWIGLRENRRLEKKAFFNSPSEKLESTVISAEGPEEHISGTIIPLYSSGKEDFEGAFPGNYWFVGDDNPTNGYVYWDDVSCRYKAGSWSGWCADIGSSTPCTQYADYMDAYMYVECEYLGTTGAGTNKLYYGRWVQVESCCDYFHAKIQGYRNNPGHGVIGTPDAEMTWKLDGSTSGWEDRVVTLGSAFDACLYLRITFYFHSDSSVHNYEGTYLDEIEFNNRSDTAIYPISGGFPTTFSPPQLVDSGCYVTPTSVSRGGRLTVYYQINNPNTSNVNVELGCSIRKNGTTPWGSDPDDDVYRSCPPGESTQSRYFDIQCDNTIGSHDVAWGLWETIGPGSPWDMLEKTNQFTVISPSYAVYGIIYNFVGGMDADSDGYYETFDFSIGIDGDVSPGCAIVYGKIICNTTGQYWWLTNPWTITGTATDYHYVFFDETSFAGHLTGNTDLDFTVEIWDQSKTTLLAQDTSVSGEPVKADRTTLVFNPNPVNTLNDTTLRDNDNADSAVPASAYSGVVLVRLASPIGGLYYLVGDFASMEDIETPSNTPPSSANTVFSYTRSQPEFEEVMCYYHITTCQQYIQTLGFTNVNNRRMRMDAHGFNGADNSHYVPSPIGTGYIAFGDGGVDDAEDADIILHEYGHSIQDNQTNGRYLGNGDIGFGNETGAMGEGFGDYWAASSTNALSVAHGFEPAIIGEWDSVVSGGLRRVDGTKHYPQDMVNEVHADGEIWSACLWQIFGAVGKQVTDKIILQAHFLVPTNPTFDDGADAIISADQILYGGSHVQAIRTIFVNRGIFPLIYPLSNDTPETFSDIPKSFSFTVNSSDWCGVAINPSSDHDIKADDNSDFSSPYASSTYGSTIRDFVVTNGHSWGSTTHYAQVYFGSSSNYTIEAEWDIPDLTVGSGYSESMSSGEVIEMYEVSLTSGQTYQLNLDITSGSGDLAVFIYKPSRNSGSRDNVDWSMNNSGAGGDETITFTADVTGDYGIAVINENASSANYTISVAVYVPPDTTPPQPNPMTWEAEPYETSTSSISMTATAASDSSLPVYYEFDFVDSPTGGSGGDDRSWGTDRTYTDSGLGANHQYGYRVRARDSAPTPNIGNYSTPVSYDYTDIEMPSGITFGTITTTSIEARSTNTPLGLTRGNSGLIIYNVTSGTDSSWKQNNDYWNSGSLSVNTQYGFKARARNGDADETPDSPTAYRYTYANPPSGTSFSNVTQTNIQANWAANENPVGTQYLCENTTRGTNSGWTSNTYWNESGLTCGTQYCYQVKAKNGDGVETMTTSLGCQYTLSCPAEINVKQGSTNIPDNTGSYDFGTVTVGQNEPVTFTIENLGSGNLDLTGSPKVEISGSQAGDFVVTQQPSTPVGPSGSTTFEITFSPSGTDLRNASVSIPNNDSDENPYNFSVVGSGEQILLSPMTVDLNNDGIPNFDDFSYFAMFWRNASCTEPNWCEGRDFDHDGIVGIYDLQIFAEFWLWPVADVDMNRKVNFVDYVLFSAHWRQTECGSPDWCYGCDFDKSGQVDITDLAVFVDYWLEGTGD